MRRTHLIAAGLAGIMLFTGVPRAGAAERTTHSGWWWIAQTDDGSTPVSGVATDQIAVAREVHAETKQAAVWFDVSDVTSPPSRVIVRLRQVRDTRSGGGGGILACPITKAWSEADGGPWSKRPTADCSSGVGAGQAGSDGYWSFDVTNLVWSWASGARANHGLALYSAQSDFNPSYEIVLGDLRGSDIHGLPGGSGAAPAPQPQPQPEPQPQPDPGPSAPTVPAAPSVPSAPGAPSVPSALDVPGAPGTPGTPGTPGAPSLPNLPSTDDGSDDPSGPDGPGSPSGPGQPGAPVGGSLPFGKGGSSAGGWATTGYVTTSDDWIATGALATQSSAPGGSDPEVALDTLTGGHGPFSSDRGGSSQVLLILAVVGALVGGTCAVRYQQQQRPQLESASD
ncbi:MAG: DNRLRE domain-containing protein [Microthrixaceae bacterium]